MLRKTSGPKRGEVKGYWRKLHSEELQGLYRSLDIIRVTTSRKIICSTYWEDKNLYRVLVVKVKFTLQQNTKAHRGEVRYSSNFSFNLGATRWGWWLTRHPVRFTPEKRTRFPMYRWLGGPQSQSGLVRNISSPPGFDPGTILARSRNTDYATLAHRV